MRLQRPAYEGERIPFGYGFVRYDFYRDARVVAPIPLNWIIRWSESLWLWALRKSAKPLTDEEIRNHERVERAVVQATEAVRFSYGIERYNAGYGVGFKAGWDAFMRNALDRLEAAEAEPEIESCPECHGIMEHVIGCGQMDKP